MAQDILEILQEDHDEVRGLFSELEDTPEDQREDLFQHIVHELARHEAAEESIVHPTLRDDVPGGEDVAGEVLEQESEAESLMAEMESLDPTSTEFLEKFRTLRDDVLDHAEHEEKEEFPRLREHLSEEQRREMGQKFQKIKDKAPTHPHPKTPQTPEVRKAVGPIAGVFDRARDTVRELFG